MGRLGRNGKHVPDRMRRLLRRRRRRRARVEVLASATVSALADEPQRLAWLRPCHVRRRDRDRRHLRRRDGCMQWADGRRQVRRRAGGVGAIDDRRHEHAPRRCVDCRRRRWSGRREGVCVRRPDLRVAGDVLSERHGRSGALRVKPGLARVLEVQLRELGRSGAVRTASDVRGMHGRRNRVEHWR